MIDRYDCGLTLPVANVPAELPFRSDLRERKKLTTKIECLAQRGKPQSVFFFVARSYLAHIISTPCNQIYGTIRKDDIAFRAET